MNQRGRTILMGLVAALMAGGVFLAWRQPAIQETMLARADLSDLSDRVVSNPTDWRAQYWYGRRLAEAGQLEQSEKALRVALGNDPDHLPGYTELGKVLLAQNRVEEAFQLLRMASGRDPSNQEARLALAVLYRTQGAYDRAEREVREVLRADPDNVPALFELAASQALMLQYAKAETTLRQALRHEPEHLPALLGLSRVLFQQGRLDEGESVARQVLRREPSNADALVLLARILSAHSKPNEGQDEALRLLGQARELDKTRLDVPWAIAQVLTAQGRWREAIPELAVVASGSPDSTQALFLLARAYRQVGDKALAAEAEAAFKARDSYDRKVRALNDEIGADPDNPRLRFRLAEIHAAMGRKDLAIASYRSGLQRDPDNRDARLKLVRLQEEAIPK